MVYVCTSNALSLFTQWTGLGISQFLMTSLLEFCVKYASYERWLSEPV